MWGAVVRHLLTEQPMTFKEDDEHYRINVQLEIILHSWLLVFVRVHPIAGGLCDKSIVQTGFVQIL